MASAAQKRERDRVLGQVADRLIEAEIEEQKQRAAEAAAVEEQVRWDKQAFEAYIEARAEYEAKQNALIEVLPRIADMIVLVDEARKAQDAALRLAQNSSTVDLPTKVLDFDTQAARERNTGAYGVPDKSRDIGSQATEAVDALRLIRRARP